MKQVIVVLAAAYSFAWRCAAVVIVVVLIALTAPREEDQPGSDSTETTAQGIVSTGSDDGVQIMLRATEGCFYSGCTLVDEAGNQLFRATYDRFGVLLVQWGDAFPVRPSCTCALDGRFRIVANAGPNRYNLRIQPDGRSGVTATHVPTDEHHALGLTREGRLADALWASGLKAIAPTSRKTTAPRTLRRRRTRITRNRHEPRPIGVARERRRRTRLRSIGGHRGRGPCDRHRGS